MKKSTLLIYLVSAFLVGLGIDRIIRNFPFLTFDGGVNVVDAANFILVIILAVFITKAIEDKKGVKLFIIDEFKDVLKIMAGIKNVIETCRNSKQVTENDKDRILFSTHEVDLMVDSIESQLRVACKHDYGRIIDKFKKIIFDYEKKLTGGRLMTSGFTLIDVSFYDEFLTNHSVAQTGVKTLIQEIYKL